MTNPEVKKPPKLVPIESQPGFIGPRTYDAKHAEIDSGSGEHRKKESRTGASTNSFVATRNKIVLFIIGETLRSILAKFMVAIAFVIIYPALILLKISFIYS